MKQKNTQTHAKNLLAFSSLIMNQIESKYLQCKTKHKPTNNIYTEQYNITSETERNPDRFRHNYIVTSIHYRSISLCCEDGTSLELNLYILLSTLCFCTKPTYIFLTVSKNVKDTVKANWKREIFTDKIYIFFGQRLDWIGLIGPQMLQ